MSRVPTGMAVGRESAEVARLIIQLQLLCRDHRANTVSDLPPDALGRAVALQAQIDALRLKDQEQREVLRERGRQGLKKAHAQAGARMEARLEAYRQRLEAEGGLYGAPARRIAREMGYGKTAGESYLKILRARDAAKQRTCPTCRQPLPNHSVIPQDDGDSNGR